MGHSAATLFGLSIYELRMSAKSKVLRVRRSDTTDDSFVLVHITTDGPSLLDLKLIATEGENPFVGTGKLSI